MCQYSSRCPVGEHRPGTICRYGAIKGGSAAVAAGAALFFVLPTLGIDMPCLSTLTARTETQPVTVTRVIDGDTIIARAEDGTDLGRVRILGIDAPELSTNDCGANAAHSAARQLLAGKDVELVTDPKNDDRDTYGRLLRYVDITTNQTSTDAGLELIRDGRVRVTARPSTHTRHDTYAYSGARSRTAGHGLWGHC